MTTTQIPRKVLVVDDSELIHRMYDLVFKPHVQRGSTLLHAMNGQEAFSQLNANQDTDLIVLDINMPVMSGLEFLVKRKETRVFTRIPVIIVSTEGKEEETVRGLEAGAAGYVTKPFKPSDLIAMMGKVMSASRPM